MNLDALLEAALMNFNEPLQKRHARKGNQSTAEFLLEEIKATIHELDPNLEPSHPTFRTAVILLAAALVVGPHVDLLVQFTGNPLPYVAEISRRMRANGLWSDDGVSTDEWLDGHGVKAMFFLHCLVANGRVQANRIEGGKRLHSAIKTTKPN